jgi:FlaG/FlaF family flagellin (archaellin)
MYNIIEQNERKDRRNALFIAVALHVALAALLYVYASEAPTPKHAKTPQAVATQKAITP